MSSRVAEDYFGSVSLTAEEEAEYIKQGEEGARRLLELTHGSVSDEGDEDWEFVKDGDGGRVKIFKNRKPHGTSGVQVIRSVCKIRQTLKGAAGKGIMNDTASFRELFPRLDEMFQDGVVVHNIPSTYEPPAIPYTSIKWAGYSSPGMLTWNRDFVLLEHQCELTDADGRMAHVSSIRSVERPEIPEQESTLKYVRGEILQSGYVFREIKDDPDCMEGQYFVQVDPKGWIPTWAVNFVAAEQGLNIMRVRDFAESHPHNGGEPTTGASGAGGGGSGSGSGSGSGGASQGKDAEGKAAEAK